MAIWINNDPPPSGPQYSECWDLVIRGTADAVANHAAMRRWDDPTNATELDNISDEEVIQRAKAKTASVVLPRNDLPLHLPEIPLPDGHINNSFKPPVESPTTPRHQRAPVRSPDFSPATSRRPSVMPTTEHDTDGDNITVAESGLLTPSKSQKSSTPALPSAFDTLKSKSKAKAPPKGAAKKTKAAPKKPGTGEVGRPAKAKAPVKTTKAKATPSASLKSSFSSSKSSITVAEGKKAPGEPLKSKLSQVSNQSPDPLNTVSLADARNNPSPTIARGTLPWLKTDSARATKDKMAMSNMIN
jgi:NAD-dependent histone deacetylase SIR2